MELRWHGGCLARGQRRDAQKRLDHLASQPGGAAHPHTTLLGRLPSKRSTRLARRRAAVGACFREDGPRGRRPQLLLVHRCERELLVQGKELPDGQVDGRGRHATGGQGRERRHRRKWRQVGTSLGIWGGDWCKDRPGVQFGAVLSGGRGVVHAANCAGLHQRLHHAHVALLHREREDAHARVGQKVGVGTPGEEQAHDVRVPPFGGR